MKAACVYVAASLGVELILGEGARKWYARTSVHTPKDAIYMLKQIFKIYTHYKRTQTGP